MDKEEQVRLFVEEEDEIQDSACQLIRKSKLQNSKTNMNSTNGIHFLNPKDEAPSNGGTIHEGQNGNSTTNGSQNGAHEHLPIVVDEVLKAEKNGGHQETEINSIYYDKDEGGNFISVFSDEESTKEGASIESSYIGSQNGIVDTSPNSVIDHQHEEHTKDDSFSDSNLQPSGVIDNINTIIQETSTVKEIESADTDLIDESDLDVADIDLEKVLQDQKTHDLYCPNCNSCITRRVILCKRKRTRPLSEDVKRNKLQAEIVTEAGAGSSEPISNQGPGSSKTQNRSPIPPAESNDRDGEPEIFRCLACFSFFIPTGNGFKLFERKREKSNSQKDQISEPKKNWLSSIFAPNKERTSQEQGILDKENKESNDKKFQTPLVIDNENRLSSLPDRSVSSARFTDRLQGNGAIKPQESPVLVNMTTNVSYKSQENAVKDELGVDNGKETLPYQKYEEGVTIDAGLVTLSNGEGAADSVLETAMDGLKLLISSDGGPELLGRSPADPKYDMESMKSRDDEALRNDSVTNNKAYIAVDIPREYEQPADINIQSEDNLKATWEVAAKAVSCKETTVTVGAGTQVASQITEEATVSTRQVASQVIGQVSVVSQRDSETGESYGIEIIKSIVYGGLVESITSLSVVSSAAGGGAATLNTLALGLANLIGGIFIICHNLYQLNYDQADDAINQVSQKNDKYQELLGKRKNFALHAFVAILSHLIFGLLPPVIFGFSFSKSDDRELKLAVVAAASFLCILVLAIAKAYVQTPPKTYVVTVLRYLILGIMVSGVSYVAGELFEKLFNDRGLFENSISVPTLSVHVKPSNNQAWTSF